MTKTWIHLINFFLSATALSYRLAVRISKKHDSVLQAAAAGADPFFVAMYNAYHPIHLALVTAYDTWLSQNGTQQSQTLTLNQLLKQLSSTKADDWMAAVKPVYKKTTARFKQLFPKLKSAFQSGSQQDKIDAVKAFSLAIGSDASLSTLKTDVDAFYGALNNAHASQKGGISTTALLSDAVELARVNSCIGQIADYGGLVQKFATHLELVGKYFDEAALRNNNQVLFHHQVKKNSVNLVAKHTALAGEQFLLENDGDVALVFGFVLHKNDHPGVVSVTVAPNTNMTVDASELTDDLTGNHYLVCFNASTIANGEFTVEML